MSKKKKTIIWISVVAAIILIIGIYFLFLRKKPQTEYTTAPVERGSVVQTVSVTGDIVDKEEVVLNFEIGGRLTNVNIKEGDHIAQGEVVAALNDADLSSQVDQAKAILDKAIADAETDDDALREARVAEENAKNTLDDTKDLNKQNLEAAEQSVKNAEDYLDDAQKFYNENPTKTNKLTLTTAENNLKAAKEAKKTTDEQNQLNETGAENTVEAAEAHVETIESEFAKRSRDAVIANAQAGYELALNNLSRSVLRAPANGIITEVNDKKGDILGTGVIKESFAKMISGDLMIEAQIPESDILKIKQGLKADFTLDALPSEEKFSGEVIEIFPAATIIQDVISYKVKFRIDDPDSRFKPGMTANLDIKTAKKDNILKIPLRAIKIEGGYKYVDVLKENNQTEKITIATGLEGDEGMAEIKSGLSEGQKVVTFTKEPQ